MGCHHSSVEQRNVDRNAKVYCVHRNKIRRRELELHRKRERGEREIEQKREKKTLLELNNNQKMPPGNKHVASRVELRKQSYNPHNLK